MSNYFLLSCCHLEIWAYDNSICLHQNKHSRALLVNHQLLVESKTNDRRLGPLASQSSGIAAKTCSFDKSPAKPELDRGKRRSSSNERIVLQKPPAITSSSSRHFTPSGPPGAAGQPASLRGAAARGEMGLGPDGSSGPGPCRTVEAPANSQSNCHCWHGPPPLQAHNLCSHGS